MTSNKKGKNYEEIYGVERAREIRKKQSNSRQKGINEKKIKIWNKGLTAENDERVAKYGGSGSRTKKKLYAEGKLLSHRKGKHHTEEAKQKNREKHLGKRASPETEFKKGNIPWNKGKKMWGKNSLTNKENPRGMLGKPSPSKGKKRPHCSGVNHPAWRGGSSFEPYGLEFNKELKEQIRKRDNYRCQECFRHQNELYDKNEMKYKLIVHHIDYNKTNNDPSNLISLCRSCHSQSNFNREDWAEYFQNRVGGG